MGTRAAIYSRISNDRQGEGLGVARQQEACEQLCARNEWTVVATLADNDQSAYSRRPRRDYRQLLGMVADGDVDVVVAWAADRLTRRLGELVELTELCDRHGVQVAVVQAGGRIDLTTPAGRLNANLLGAVAEYESAHRGARVKAKHQQLREQGKALRGGTRPYGYADDRVTVVAEEAAVIRRMAAEVVAGSGPGSVANRLTKEGVPTAHGADRWTVGAVRRMLTSARVAGYREDPATGALFEAEWPAILDVPTWRHCRAALAPRARPRARARTYLLTGLVVCGLCGKPLHATPQHKGGVKVRAMACRSETGGCAKTHVRADPLEAVVVDQLLSYLAQGPLAAALGDELGASRAQAEALAEVARIEEHRQQVVADYGHRVIDRATFGQLIATIDADLAAARDKAGRPSPTAALQPLGADPLDGWAALVAQGATDRMRAIVGLMVAEVRVDPPDPKRARNRFQPERVRVTFK